MQTENQAKLQKIKKVSSILRVICKELLALFTLIGLGCVVCVASGTGSINYDSMNFSTAELTLGTRLMLGAVTALTFGVLLKCCYHLHQLSETTPGERFLPGSRSDNCVTSALPVCCGES